MMCKLHRGKEGVKEKALLAHFMLSLYMRWWAHGESENTPRMPATKGEKNMEKSLLWNFKSVLVRMFTII